MTTSQFDTRKKKWLEVRDAVDAAVEAGHDIAVAWVSSTVDGSTGARVCCTGNEHNSGYLCGTIASMSAEALAHIADSLVAAGAPASVRRDLVAQYLAETARKVDKDTIVSATVVNVPGN